MLGQTSTPEKIFQQCQIKDLRELQVKLAQLRAASLLAMDILKNIETSLQESVLLVSELSQLEDLK